jgi:hypothetical protein
MATLWNFEIQSQCSVKMLEYCKKHLDSKRYALCFWPQYYTRVEGKKNENKSCKGNASFFLFHETGFLWIGERDQKKIDIHLESLAKKNPQCDVVVMDSDVRVFSLPRILAEHLSIFMRKKKDYNWLDCGRFITFLFQEFGPDGQNLIGEEVKSEEELNVGDAILWLQRNELILPGEKCQLEHAALYIGCGYYLSKFGAGGYLVVSSLNEMQNFYSKSSLYR